MPRWPNDLFGGAQLSLAPDTTRSEPRLWIRRLTIWPEPGAPPIRDISFRPGLNIVWSRGVRETSGDQEGVIGHGSGKTLLCRLIRYCMGERRFAPEDQRTAIGAKFLEGIVGAEIMLDGTRWAILRPLGHRQRHVAVPNGNLEAIAAGEGAHTGMEPFIAAVEGAFFTPESIALVPGNHGWLTELAWLTRDQECGFNRALDWRDPSSGSESPVGNLRTDEARLFALRVFLKAITPEERALDEEIKEMEAERDHVKQETAHRAWEAEQRKKRLAAELGLKEEDLEGPLAADALKQAARKQLAKVARVSPDSGHVDPAPIREELRRARTEERALGERLAEMKARIEEKDRNVGRMEKEVFGLALSTDEEENPACPICEVPIDRVLAEGCKLSHKLVDLESIRQKRENHRRTLEDEHSNLTSLRGDLSQTEQEYSQARDRTAELDRQLQAVEKARDAQADAWYQARRMVDEAARYEQLLEAHASASKSLDALGKRLEAKREQMTLFRERQRQLFTKISGLFDHTVQQLVGSEATGSVRLTGNGLELKIHFGGDRSTPGINCIKILAFDLTALSLSTEKDAQIAPFFIHDSPREADLDIEVYYRHFRYIRWMEEQFDYPPFQYIVTTTTPPPDDLMFEPWLRQTLRGSPGSERLLGCDL